MQTITIKARNAEQKLGNRRSLETPVTAETVNLGDSPHFTINIFIIIMRGVDGAFWLWGLVVTGRCKKNLKTYAWLSRKRFYTLCSSCATEDFRSMKRNSELIECKFQTLSRGQVFGTDFGHVFHRFRYFTLATEPVRVKPNAWQMMVQFGVTSAQTENNRKKRTDW